MKLTLSDITPAEITEALTKKKKSNKQNFFYRRDQYGRLVMFYGKPPASENGRFFGKAGTTPIYDDTNETVVAYKVKP